MKATYYTNNGTTQHFTRDTLDECITEYYRRRRNYCRYGGANWGHVFINGERTWLA